MGKFDFEDETPLPRQYKQQIERVNASTGFIKSIEETTKAAVHRVSQGSRSFVIFGEPQSGKTEMMICLVARLLDEGHKHIVVLVNDNVSLQNQNLSRFARSGLSPTPVSLSDIKSVNKADPELPVIIFCKKNRNDLAALLDRVDNLKNRVVIDDEGDYATPNARVNSGTQSTINGQVQKLIGSSGIYIAVTATPARLDLNRTFDNDNSEWIFFAPYPDYAGRDTFFRSLNPSENLYQLQFIPDSIGEGPGIQEALVHFVVNVAYLNLKAQLDKFPEQNWSLLIHTSGSVEDHERDRKIVETFFRSIESNKHSSYVKIFNAIEAYATTRYPDQDAMSIARYVWENRQRRSIKVINSDNNLAADIIRSVTTPDSRFTIGIGGNVISRGVTFDNLLGMYFTREARVMQQDTYIQRARMFGNRKGYVSHFELHIPRDLYADWYNAFALHSLSMASIINGEPVWVEQSDMRAAATSSVKKSDVVIDSGQVSFPIFKLTKQDLQLTSQSLSGYQSFDSYRTMLKRAGVNKHVIDFILTERPSGDDSVVMHAAREIRDSKNQDAQKIWRARGLMGGQDYERDDFPSAVHHLKVFYNSSQDARVVYHYRATDKNVKFLRTSAPNKNG